MKKNTISDWFNSLPAYVRLIIILVIIILIYIIGKKLYTIYQTNKKQKLLENSTQTTTFVNSSGQTVTQTIDLGTKANKIYNDFYNNDWFGISENEESARIELIGVPKTLVPELSNIYFQLYSKNMKNDFQSYLSDSQYQTISNLFL